MGVRGPLGNGYPLETFKGKNLLLIGGGFGFSTLRSLTNYILHEENRKAYGDLTVIYGARKPGLLLYKEDLDAWRQRADLQAASHRGRGGGRMARAMSASCPMVTAVSGAKRRKYLRGSMRTPGDDEVHLARAQEPGIRGRTHPFLPRDADEMRHREVRPL